jgi:hypothetical protein
MSAILKYRVAPHRYPAAPATCSAVLQLERSRLGVDPLASASSVCPLADTLPLPPAPSRFAGRQDRVARRGERATDFVAPLYPVITTPPLCAYGSRDALLDRRESPRSQDVTEPTSRRTH